MVVLVSAKRMHGTHQILPNMRVTEDEPKHVPQPREDNNATSNGLTTPRQCQYTDKF